jgi:glutathione S-transferase
VKLWHCADTRSLRPLWLLEELGLTYELELMAFPPRLLHKPFLQDNPLGTVPYFVDGAAQMTESSAICHYLASRYGDGRFLVQPEHPDFGLWLNWLYMADATLTFPQTLVLRYRFFEAQQTRIPQVAEDYRKWYLARLRLLDSHLLEHQWLAADQFSIADIAVGYALFLGQCIGLADDYQPQTRAYLERLIQREGFKRARQKQHDSNIPLWWQSLGTSEQPD